MAVMAVLCPYCNSDHLIKGGKTTGGKQRYRCLNGNCSHRSFVFDPAYAGRLPKIKQHIIDMALDGSGVRDTARILGISPATVINELKPSSRSTERFSRRCILMKSTSLSVEWTKQKSTKCVAS